ncbi:hypothetical protein AVEN_113395-1 [Araneus ventricosus]|uniref:Uncharacterized protein n=1 Tax=Araneus ventricosus TaxID=182803 RepID=A0A4Y2NZP7_ARAVE|nr:hypothetical protein AVEN_113395-1 [Araneus ventricosus]
MRGLLYDARYLVEEVVSTTQCIESDIRNACMLIENIDIDFNFKKRPNFLKFCFLDVGGETRTEVKPRQGIKNRNCPEEFSTSFHFVFNLMTELQVSPIGTQKAANSAREYCGMMQAGRNIARNYSKCSC